MVTKGEKFSSLALISPTKVSASPYEHMLGKPDVKYIGNIHGNEAVGRELLLHLIEYFVTSYGTDPYIKWLLDNTRIHIMPAMNPDGYAASREGECEGGKGRWAMIAGGSPQAALKLTFLVDRSNSKGYDLNRNFPDYFKQNTKRTQPETEAVKDWISKIQFLLSGSLHGGALVSLCLLSHPVPSRRPRNPILIKPFLSLSPPGCQLSVR
jgi:carboxypeptidase M